MATSLTSLARPAAAQAGRDFEDFSRSIRNGGYRHLFLAVVLILVAALFKSIGLVSLVWVLIIVVEAYVAFNILPYLLGLTVPTWVPTFFTGLIGEANGAREGIENADKWTKKLWRFGLWAVCYSSLALWVVALWNVEENFHLILPLIASGLGVTFLAVLLFDSGERPFFAWVMYAIKLTALLIMLAMITPGVVGLTITRFVDNARNATKAHKAEDRMLRARNDAIGEARAECHEDLVQKMRGDPAKKIKGVLPTQADIDKCNAIGVEKKPEEATPFVTGMPKTDGHGVPDEVVVPPAPKAPPAQRVAEAKPADDPNCNKLDKEYMFNPGRHGSRVNAGVLQAGRYQVKAIGASQEDFVLHAWGHALPIENGLVEIRTGGALPIQLGMNNGRQEPVHVEIKQCTTV